MRPLFDVASAWEGLKGRPLVHQLTSAVAASWQADVTAAVGASPVLSAHPEEAREIASRADALLLNTGMATENSPQAFAEALAGLGEGRPCLVDPVGYGLTAWRTAWIDGLLASGRPMAVKGNGAEMARLGKTGGILRGIEAVQAEGVAKVLFSLAARGGLFLLVATGPEDRLFFHGRLWTVRGGSPRLPALVGSGCCLGSVMAACLAVADPLSAGLAALLAFRLAAERALPAAGPSRYRQAFVDGLASLGGADLEEGRVRIAGPFGPDEVP